MTLKFFWLKGWKVFQPHYRVKGGPKCGFWGLYSVFYSFLTRKCPKNHFQIFDIFWNEQSTVWVCCQISIKCFNLCQEALTELLKRFWNNAILTIQASPCNLKNWFIQNSAYASALRAFSLTYSDSMRKELSIDMLDLIF